LVATVFNVGSQASLLSLKLLKFDVRQRRERLGGVTEDLRTWFVFHDLLWAATGGLSFQNCYE
jgi:hypothetical protein